MLWFNRLLHAYERLPNEFMNGVVSHADAYIFAIHKWLSPLSAGTKFRGVISHWWFSAGGQRRVSHIQTHTFSRAEIKVEESAASPSPCMRKPAVVSFKMFVRTMWNSHFTHDSVTLNHYSHWKSSHFALAENARVRLALGLECKLRQYFIAITLAGIPGRSYSHAREKRPRRLRFLGKHVFNSLLHPRGNRVVVVICFQRPASFIYDFNGPQYPHNVFRLWDVFSAECSLISILQFTLNSPWETLVTLSNDHAAPVSRKSASFIYNPDNED
jgi:hypothetical protein